MLAPGEMFPTARTIGDEVQGTAMEGVEHLGQYVFEMTQAKIKALGGQDAIVDESMPDEQEDLVEDGDEIMLGAGEEGDEDPLHEHVLP
jgi:intron-binding protein aquarius